MCVRVFVFAFVCAKSRETKKIGMSRYIEGWEAK